MNLRAIDPKPIGPDVVAKRRYYTKHTQVGEHQ